MTNDDAKQGTIATATVHYKLYPEANKNIFLGVVVVLVSVASPIPLLFSNGIIISAFAIPVLLAVAFISFQRLDWGFYLLVGSVLLFDQFGHKQNESFSFLTGGVQYFTNLRDIPYLPRLDFATFNGFELHFFFIVTIWFFVAIVAKRMALVPVPLWISAVLFFLWLLFSFFHGLLSGGAFLPALWELRALFYFCLMFFFVPQIIQTKQQVRALLWVCMLAVSIKTLQALVNFMRAGLTFGHYDFLTASQEDAVFIVSMLLLFSSMMMLNVKGTQRYALIALLTPLWIAFLAANRRAAYVSLVSSLVSSVFLVPKKIRLKVLSWGIGFTILILVYLAIFWNNESRLAIPAMQIKSILFQDDPSIAGYRNYSSNVYREAETYNLAYTIGQSPILGVGFGKPYSTPINLFLTFGLSKYVAHNSLLWLFMRTGLVGFALFLFFFNSFIHAASKTFTRISDPYSKAVCLTIILAIVNQIINTNVEMHFTLYRTMVFLGVLMGLQPALLDGKKGSNTDAEVDISMPKAHSIFS